MKDFTLYVESLKQIVPWFFALDHQNYSRWIPVHIRDMESLPPPIFEEFKENGHWVVSKTMNRFSAMPIDQCHEQNNEVVKGSGGAVGLTENPSAFQKWMLAGPEQARLFLGKITAKGQEDRQTDKLDNSNSFRRPFVKCS